MNITASTDFSFLVFEFVSSEDVCRLFLHRRLSRYHGGHVIIVSKEYYQQS